MCQLDVYKIDGAIYVGRVIFEPYSWQIGPITRSGSEINIGTIDVLSASDKTLAGLVEAHSIDSPPVGKVFCSYDLPIINARFGEKPDLSANSIKQVLDQLTKNGQI